MQCRPTTNYHNPPPYFKGKLYQKLDVRAIRDLCEFQHQTPTMLTEADVRAFMLHQIVELEVASGTQSVLLSGIKFFFRTTLPRKWKVLDQTKINYTHSLPDR